MPKIIKSIARFRNFVKEFGEDIFSCDNAVLFCKVCGVKVSAEKKYNIQQHIARGKHIQQLNIRNQQEKPKSQVLVTGMSMKSSFNEELCNVFLSANIPLTKLNIPIVRNFLHKHTKQIIPDESTLRKNYIDQCYTNTIIKIRDYVRNKNIWVSIDETTDVEGRYVANVIIGTLEVDNPGKIFLLNSEVLEKANHSTISTLFEHFLHIKNVILQLDSDDALAIKHAKQLVENPEIEANLIYIKSNFGFLATEITRLETSGMLLSESVCCIEKVKQQIKQASGKTGETVTK